MVNPIADAPLAAGSVFADRYRIERVITHGVRKWTYLASDMKARGHRQVALAVMEPGHASAASQREVEMMGKVGAHDCIVTLHDFDLDAPSPYLVFEYLPGGRLRDHCRDLQAMGAQMPLTDFFRTARQLCRALAHVHEHGVIHRDVAATNILLDKRGVAHLGDFDQAISAEEASMGALVPLNPEGFAAPELLSRATPDHRADLYALGAVLYELLAGALPPVGEAPTAKAPPSRLRPDIPPRLDTLIVSMLAADRAERPCSAQAVLDELRDIERTADLELLIAGGESASLELKQTMRWDIEAAKTSAEILKMAVKAVCSFLNSQGGILLIGVTDTGDLTGLDDDLAALSMPTLDGFERAFRQGITNGLDPDAGHLVTVSFPTVRGVQICRVDVKSAPRPVFLVGKGVPPEFRVRKGNASPILDVKETYEYISEHWGWREG